MTTEELMALRPQKQLNPLEVHLKDVVNKSWNYAKKCKTYEDHVQNAVLGLAGEVGEVVDLHKKFFFHQDKPYSELNEKLKHEIGDVFFYLVKLMELHDLSLDEVLKANKEKLESRHPEFGKVKERFQDGYIR